MRVSEQFKLGLSQPQLDFVDVEINGDVPVFVDPQSLLLLDTEWANECVELVKHFFRVVLEAIRTGHDQRAQQLLATLREPNETRLGFSSGKPAGRGLGPEMARRVRHALSESEAVRSGLLTDLEDAILMIEGIGPDLISDITTNVIREPLLEYTQRKAQELGIELQDDVHVGPFWNTEREAWDQTLVSAPKPGRPLLLVPKSIVRTRLDYDHDEYYRDYLIPFLREAEIDAGSSLVETLRDGRVRVTNRALIAKYGIGKRAVERLSREHPEVLDRYRAAKAQNVRAPISHAQLSELTNTPPIDWDALLAAVKSLRRGAANATTYHRAVEALLTPLFYPALSMPELEAPLHGGRKRVDIRYSNGANRGFFDWLRKNYRAPYVFVECKNYTGDPGNAELDQLSGRFSPHRGEFGLLICRDFTDKQRFIERCRDSAHDSRGYIIALDDTDLEALVDARKAGDGSADLGLLRARFAELVS